ncbi:hypothetical protein HYZ06_01230 [Candidatus Daviesbacteria bacterium]|nr:hypothetical protein [Candidatus Daviesbacteria bacterium]
MAETNVEIRAKNFLKLIDGKVQVAQEATADSFRQLDVDNVRGLPERAETMRAAAEDLNSLLIVRHTLRAVLGLGTGFVVRLSAGEELKLDLSGQVGIDLAGGSIAEIPGDALVSGEEY